MQNIRNFCIIAHIDHGKSTLADRMIETTGTRSKREMKDRVMDTLELERERGITIKLQTARMVHNYKGEEYILNLIDTPGHVDFSYEVSRSVAAAETALLLVDATQSIQAQTFSTMFKAMDYELKIIPVINKIDLPSADVERVKREMIDTFGFAEEEFILTSGKSGIGVSELLDRIVEVGPPPGPNSLVSPITTASECYQTIDNKPVTKALIFDSFYHEYKGVVALIKIIDGSIKQGQDLYVVGSETIVKPIEIGYLRPEMYESNEINNGEVGYIATGLKDIHQVHVGDTVSVSINERENTRITPLPGYQSPKQMVFASLYPVEASDFTVFQESLEKLALNDAALTYERENSTALGSGFVCGFLGLLHLEVTIERLEREFDLNLISTTPTVSYEIALATTDYSKVPGMKMQNLRREDNMYVIRTAAEYPSPSLIKEIREPWLKVEILTPEKYVGKVMELCQESRGSYLGMDYLTKHGFGENKHVNLKYELPTAEIIVNFFDRLKGLTNGYASLDYEFLDYRSSDIVKLAVVVNHEEIEALSLLVHRTMAERRGRQLVEKLVDIIPRQNFAVPIQAAINTKVIARETISAYRKDVIAKLYGGDITRKKKLLEKQKRGKKRLKMFGKIEIPKEAFLAAMKVD